MAGAEAGLELEGGQTWLFSIRGGQQSYYYLKSLSKLALKQNLLLLNHAIGGGRAPAGPPLAPPLHSFFI
jgi:hypothetical protein